MDCRNCKMQKYINIDIINIIKRMKNMTYCNNVAIALVFHGDDAQSLRFKPSILTTRNQIPCCALNLPTEVMYF